MNDGTFSTFERIGEMATRPRKSRAMVKIGRQGGQVKSAAKAKASRLNGAKGGRPTAQQAIARQILDLHGTGAGWVVEEGDGFHHRAEFHRLAVELARLVIGGAR